MYPSYTATAIRNILDLNQKHKTNLQGILTWAFEFEDQPYFAGFRDLATNGVDKPVLNLFRMLGMMGNQRIAAVSGAVDVGKILEAVFAVGRYRHFGNPVSTSCHRAVVELSR